MAYEKAALEARGVQVVAVSPDSVAQGAKMAAKYNIDFALLSDPEHHLAKKYSGVDTNGFPIPSIFILRQDGTVYFKKSGERKGDRIDAARLLAIVDEMQGNANRSDIPGVSGFKQNFQLRLGLAGGVLDDEETSAAIGLDLATLYDIGDYFATGLQSGGLAYPELRGHASLVARGRLPYLEGLGELYLQAPLGIAYQDDVDAAESLGWHTGLTLGTEIRGAPGSQIYGELSYERDTFASDLGESLTAHSFLLKLGYGWRF